MAACYFLHSFSGGAKSAEGPCEFDPPRQECTGKTSTGNTFACAAQRLGGGLNPALCTPPPAPLQNLSLPPSLPIPEALPAPFHRLLPIPPALPNHTRPQPLHPDLPSLPPLSFWPPSPYPQSPSFLGIPPQPSPTPPPRLLRAPRPPPYTPSFLGTVSAFPTPLHPTPSHTKNRKSCPPTSFPRVRVPKSQIARGVLLCHVFGISTCIVTHILLNVF